jgi:hypothetical protein
MPVKQSYSDSLSLIRSVVPEFDLLSPKDVPFLKAISGGTDDEPSLNSLKGKCIGTKHEWVEKGDPALDTTVGAAAAAGDVTIGFPAPFLAALQEGQIYLNETTNEQFIVGAPTGGRALAYVNPVPVSRAFAGTVAAAMSVGQVLRLVGRAHLEGADAPADRFITPAMPWNVVQEITATIDVSEFEEAIQRYGFDDAVETETMDKTRALMRQLSRQVFLGRRSVGSANSPASMGGLGEFIDIAGGNVQNAASGALTSAMVHNVMQSIYEKVGLSQMPDLIVCNAWGRRKLTQIFATTNVTTFRDQEERRGGVKVDTIVTDFGDVGVLLDDTVRPTDVWLIRSDCIGIGPLQGKELRREPLAKVGTSDRWMLTGGYTLEVRGWAKHGLIKNISLVA